MDVVVKVSTDESYTWVETTEVTEAGVSQETGAGVVGAGGVGVAWVGVVVVEAAEEAEDALPGLRRVLSTARNGLAMPERPC